MSLVIWKFTLDTQGQYIQVPGKPDYSIQGGYLAVAIAESEADARAIVSEFTKSRGATDDWLKLAKVVQVPFERRLVGYAE